MSMQPSSSNFTSSHFFVVHKSSLSIPHFPSFRQFISSAYDSLYEYNYLLKDSKIPIIDLPCLNPYTACSKPFSSILKSIKTLIHKPAKIVKEYVASTNHASSFYRLRMNTILQTQTNNTDTFFLLFCM